jgi:hypothetical protein
MAFDLLGRQGSYQIQQSDFAPILELAVRYGWEPEGTTLDGWLVPEECREEVIAAWDGIYSTNDGQLVSQPDAFALAVALDKAISAEFGWRWLRPFVEYCRGGGFRILV